MISLRVFFNMYVHLVDDSLTFLHFLSYVCMDGILEHSSLCKQKELRKVY